jgi:hypothetical protein
MKTVKLPPALSAALALSALALFASCKSDRLTLLMIDGACRCNVDSLQKIAALQVHLEGEAVRDSRCVKLPQPPEWLGLLQDALRDQVTFTGIDQGSYSLSVLGYEDDGCASEVVACGNTSLTFPSSTAAIDVPMRCMRRADGSPATISAAACIGQTTAPDRCSDIPAEGDASVPHDGAPLMTDLPAPALGDDGTCSSSRVEEADSAAVALYTQGGTLVARTCVAMPDNPQDLDTVQSALPSPIFADLDPGEYLLMITGHDDPNCPDDVVLFCGGGLITLPVTSPAPVEIRCRDDSDMISEETCLSSLE